MIEIIRKSFILTRLAFLISSALFLQGFCVNTFAQSTDEKWAFDTAVYSSIGQKNIAGNAGIEKSSLSLKDSEQVANTALEFAFDDAESLVKFDKLTYFGETETYSVLPSSIPETEIDLCDDADEYYYDEIVYCTHFDAIDEVIFENSTLLENDIETSNSAIQTETAADNIDDENVDDELTSGSSAVIGTNNTDSDDETQTTTEDGGSSDSAVSDDETETTTEDGKSSKKASSGGGSSSSKAEKRNDSDNDKDRNDASNEKQAESDKPGKTSTDTPDASKNEPSNDNGVNGTDNALSEKDSEDDNASDGSGIEASDNTDDIVPDITVNDGNSDYSSGNDLLPQTGSPVGTMTVTLCGLILTAVGVILIRKNKKA